VTSPRPLAWPNSTNISRPTATSRGKPISRVLRSTYLHACIRGTAFLPMCTLETPMDP
jgi:hypothetical protein